MEVFQCSKAFAGHRPLRHFSCRPGLGGRGGQAPQLYPRDQLKKWDREKVAGGKARFTGSFSHTRNDAPKDWAIKEIGWMRLQPGASIGMHKHEANEDTYIIVSGEGVFTDTEGRETPGQGWRHHNSQKRRFPRPQEHGRRTADLSGHNRAAIGIRAALRGPPFHPQARLWFETLVFRPNRPAPDPEEAGIRRGQVSLGGAQDAKTY